MTSSFMLWYICWQVTLITLKSSLSDFHFFPEFKHGIYSMLLKVSYTLKLASMFSLNWALLHLESGANFPPMHLGNVSVVMIHLQDVMPGMLGVCCFSSSLLQQMLSQVPRYQHYPIVTLLPFLAPLPIISWTPPKCGYAGEISNHCISLCNVNCLILSTPNWFTNSLDSFSAFLKFSPLSDTTFS